MIDLPVIDPPAIVVTASRSEEEASASAASVTVIDEPRIGRLGAPLVADLLRLAPSVAVATSGPAGSLTQVRIRGAEATHTLLFVDGIRANDPAAGNEPRFELLNADLASRIEIVRGPQSALWGSEAIGGVVAVSGPAPGSGGTTALLEAGSFSTWRAAARTEAGTADRGVAIGLAGQGSEGIDSFGGGGDRDGYRNLAVRASGRYLVAPGLLLGTSAFSLRGKSEYDGLDPVSFVHADTLDETRNRLTAGRIFAEAGNVDARYARLSASLLASLNRNTLAGALVNETEARRQTIGLEAGQNIGRNRLIVALEAEKEIFDARDAGFGGATNQHRSRRHQSLTAEWRAEQIGPINAGLAVRHDSFSRFKDATSVRASLRASLGGGWAIAGSYGEGIAQPTFFDLYGFFPGSFSGNPDLRPESSRGGEISLRYASARLGGSLTYYRQRLRDEIIDLFDPITFQSTTANADARSRRQGIELEAFYAPSEALRLTLGYGWLEAGEPSSASGMVKEARRPKHSGTIALDGAYSRLSYGASVSYAGARADTNFDVFPAMRVRLRPYWLASARIGWRLTDTMEAQLRVANALGADYQDAIGYRTEGRSVHAGLRFALGR